MNHRYKIFISIVAAFIFITACSKPRRQDTPAVKPAAEAGTAIPEQIRESTASIEPVALQEGEKPFDFEFPTLNGDYSLYKISSESGEYGFRVPGEVKNEVVAFNSLVDVPEVSSDGEAAYVLITRDKTKIYEQPDIKSQVQAEVPVGEIFLLEEALAYPDDPDKLPEAKLKAMKKQYGWTWAELKERRYLEVPGEIVEGRYNRWLKVRGPKASGWVFGAFTFETDKDTALVFNELYRRGEGFRSYQDYFIYHDEIWYSPMSTANHPKFEAIKEGVDRISTKQKNRLTKEYLLLEQVATGEYKLSSEKPDDMISLYMNASVSGLNPILITTDLVIHTLHLIFDHSLQEVEVEYFLPFIESFSYRMLQRLQELRTTEIPGETINLLSNYYGVVLTLLNPPPELEKIPEWEGGRDREQREKRDRERSEKYERFLKALSGLGEESHNLINRETALVNSAKGITISPLLKIKEDYSLFKVRGHYTKSPALTTYFKAMMWLGLMKFPLTDNSRNLTPEFMMNCTRAAVTATKLITSDAPLFRAYNRFKEAIDFLIGVSNDITPVSYNEYLKKYPELDDLAALGNDDLVKRITEQAEAGLPDPEVRGTFNGKVFQMMGQRFTLDASILTKLSHDAVLNRRRVKTWDIPAAMNSTWAEEQVDEDKKKYNGYAKNLASLQTKIKNKTDENLSSFYSSYLASLGSLLAFPQDTGIPWFDSANYIKKNHLCFFGAYTELKHDTILYSVQAFAAEMGGGIVKYNFVKDPLPRARGYVEPNLPFYRNLVKLYNHLAGSQAGALLFQTTRGKRFADFMQEVAWLYKVVQKEVGFKPLSREDYERIFELPTKLAGILTPSDVDYATGYQGDSNDYKGALVADIYTNPRAAEALTLGTGIPYRIYMTVYDPDGGRRTCVGYTYSYYEFWQSTTERLNDEKWKELVYKTGGSTLSEKEPDWIKELVE